MKDGNHGKMLGNQKRFGRCRVPGHGAECPMTIEVQSTPTSRTTEKAAWNREADHELWD